MAVDGCVVLLMTSNVCRRAGGRARARTVGGCQPLNLARARANEELARREARQQRRATHDVLQRRVIVEEGADLAPVRRVVEQGRAGRVDADEAAALGEVCLEGLLLVEAEDLVAVAQEQEGVEPFEARGREEGRVLGEGERDGVGPAGRRRLVAQGVDRGRDRVVPVPLIAGSGER